MTAIELDDVLPTEADVAFYAEHGWWLSPPIFGDAELDAAVEASERYYAGEPTDGPWIPEIFRPVQPPYPGLRKHDYASLHVPELFALVSSPVLAAIAARLSGADGLRLWHDQLLYKPPTDGTGPTNVGWHTDRSYWGAATSETMVTAWVPFHEITADLGPLTMMDGSNRWGREHTGKPDFFRQDIDVQVDEIGRQSGRKIHKVELLMARGQVSFHDCRTFHGSGPNRSTIPRRSLAIHLQPSDNEHCGEREEAGRWRHHANNDLVRTLPDGRPDYADPVYCPALWPR